MVLKTANPHFVQQPALNSISIILKEKSPVGDIIVLRGGKEGIVGLSPLKFNKENK